MRNELDQEQVMLKTVSNFRYLINGRDVSSKMSSLEVPKSVTPAKAGVQKWLIPLNSRLRGNDENCCFLTFYECINLQLSQIFVSYRV